MSGGSKFLLKAADRLVAFEAGGALRSVDDGVAAARSMHAKLHRHLAPVIGDAGFEALFARSVKLTKSALPALRAVDTNAPAGTALEQLCACLKQQSPAGIVEIITALMITFVNLLSTFIGEGLTWKLLRNAWPEALRSEVPSGEKP